MSKIKLVQVKEFSDEFKDYWKECIRDFMAPGWETWIYDIYLPRRSFLGEDGLDCLRVHVENNKYGINFPFDCFKIIE